jgi:hypothetical protein
VQSNPMLGTSATAQAPGNAVPDQLLDRWSWGPFFLWLFWVFWNADSTHKIIAIAIFVCNFIPFVHFLAWPASLVFAIYLGIKGNRLMAANRQFASLADFVAVQAAWARWGVIVFIVSALLVILMIAIFGAALIAIGIGAAASDSHAR